jgi:hypothetical protein
MSVCQQPLPPRRSPAAGRAGDLRGAVVAADPEAAGALGGEALAAALAAARAGLSRHQVLALARRLAPGAAAVPVDPCCARCWTPDLAPGSRGDTRRQSNLNPKTRRHRCLRLGQLTRLRATSSMLRRKQAKRCSRPCACPGTAASRGVGMVHGGAALGSCSACKRR